MTPTILRPRPYQEDALAAVQADWAAGFWRTAVVHATGLGKGVVIAHLIERTIRNGGRVAVMVHRDRLVKQLSATIHTVAPGLSIGVVQAERHEIDHHVVMISVQTIAPENGNRLNAIPADHFSLVIVDECHHASAEGYVRALRYFGCYDEPEKCARCDGGSAYGGACTDCLGTGSLSRPPRTRLTGFTATLVRADKRGLGSVFEKVSHSLDILWGIRNGYLVEPRGKTLTVDALDLDDVARTGGDYQVGALGRAMVQSHAPAVFARAIKDHAGDRQGFQYWPTKDAAYAFKAECDALGITCAVIEEHVPTAERDRIYANVAAGHIQVISNVRTETEGIDIPQMSFVGDGSPTSNVGLMIQKIGRGLRVHRSVSTASQYPWMRKAKTDCLVFRLAGATTVKLASLTDLSSVVIREIKDDETLTEAIDREAGEDEDTRARIRKVTVTDADLFAKSSSDWLQTTKGYWFLPTSDWLIAMYPEDLAWQTFKVGKVWVGKGRRRPSEKVWGGMTLDYGMAMAESLAEELDPVGTLASRKASWKQRKSAPATEAQISYARGSLGIKNADQMTKVELSHLMSTVIGTRKLDRYIPPAPKEN
jgi:superfamily II DNA or RNA helicase